MTPETEKERLMTLMGLLFDQTISDDEIQELNDYLDGSRENQLLYKRFLDLHCQLQLDLDTSDNAVRSNFCESSSAHPVLRRRRLATAAMVAVLAVVIVAVSVMKKSPPNSELQASLGQFEGDVVVTGVNGETIPASHGIDLHQGYAIETRGSDSFATLRYSDKTQFVLVSNTSAAIDENNLKNVQVRRGRLICQVENQSLDNSFRVATPHANVQVLGTRFVLESRRTQTDISVTKGRVTVTDANEEHPIEISQGKFLTANEGSPFIVQEASSGDFEWSEDFERGLPEHWQNGDFESDGLPGQSKGGVRATKIDYNGQVLYAAISQEEWARGLFVFRSDLHLHVTFKMDRPNWINVFFIGRTNDPKNPKTFLHEFNKLLVGQPGEWRKVTIPLSDFRTKTDKGFENISATDGEIVFGINLSSTEPDRGLVIDEISVTRGGPGKVVYEQLK